MAKQPDKDEKPVTPPKAIQGAQADTNSPPPAPRHSNRLRSIHSTRLKALEDEALRAPIEERAEFSDSAGGLRWWWKVACSAISPGLRPRLISCKAWHQQCVVQKWVIEYLEKATGGGGSF